MAKKRSNYSILVDVELDTSNIQKQLDKNTKVQLNTTDAIKSLLGLDNAMEDTSLTFQAANEVFSTTKDILMSMVNQVYELDSAIIEFQKVSDLTGEALDNYVQKLNSMGDSVAKTGKPKCQAPDDGIVNQHQYPLEIQYNLRAYSTTMVA